MSTQALMLELADALSDLAYTDTNASEHTTRLRTERFDWLCNEAAKQAPVEYHNFCRAFSINPGSTGADILKGRP